jgi:uncharacterized protein YprB with RNaseH-like and TPR domain
MDHDLQTRLRKLRPPGADDRGGQDAALQARLSRLGRRSQARADAVCPQGLAELLQGQVLDEGVIVLDREIAWDGVADLYGGLQGLPEGLGVEAEEWLLLDTETTGLAGGTGTLVFLIGLARRRPGGLQLRQWLLTRFAGEARMLRAAQAWLGRAGLVSYNGKSFDVPLLRTRTRLSRLADDWDGRPHLDLLYPVRRAFAGLWPDCRLLTVERRLLGFERVGDLPGAAAPQAWLDYVRRGEPQDLLRVVEHNRQDLVSLGRAVPLLAALHQAPWQFGAAVERVAQAWLRVGRSGYAARILDAAAGSLDTPGLQLLGQLLRRAQDWQRACAVWERLAERGDNQAIEQLAIYHEHVRRDLSTARSWAGCLPPGPARDRRLSRLRRKLGRLPRLPLSAEPSDGRVTGCLQVEGANSK